MNQELIKDYTEINEKKKHYIKIAWDASILFKDDNVYFVKEDSGVKSQHLIDSIDNFTYQRIEALYFGLTGNKLNK